VILAGFFWLAIMVTLSCADELSRGWEIVPKSWNMIIPLVSRLF
jgi:hypothetical protein